MKRILPYMIISLFAVLISCDTEDDPVGFPVGSWQLSAIVFENGSNITELTSSRLKQFNVEFMSDGTAISDISQTKRTLDWVYDSATDGLQLSDGANAEAYTVESSSEMEFRYQVANIGTMGNPTSDQIAMAELAANTFNQNMKDYDPSVSLSIYFKFELQ